MPRHPQSRHGGAKAIHFLTCGLLFAGLSTAELLAVVVFGIGDLQVGFYPLFLWFVAVLAGGSAGSAIRWALTASDSARDGRAPGPPAYRATRLLLVGQLVLIALLQIHHLRLADADRGSGLAVIGLTVKGLLVLALVRSRSFSGPWLAGSSTRNRALLGTAASLAPALLAMLLATTPPAGLRAELWSPVPAAPRATATGERSAPRMALLGIDGATWEIIGPLLREERMPNLAALLQRGHGGVLRNPDIREYVSPVAWATILTGLWPEQHGVRGWETARTESRRAKPIWGLADDLGWRSLVVNVPAAYPAESLNGVVLAGKPLPEVLRGTMFGWRATSRPPGHDIAAGPLRVRVRPSDAPVLAAFRGMAFRAALRRTSPGIVLRALGLPLLEEVERALVGVTPPLFSLHLETNLQEPDSSWRLIARDAGDKPPLFKLRGGEWGPWLSLRNEDATYLTRAKCVAVGPEGFDLFIAPLAKSPLPGIANLQRALTGLPVDSGPYLAAADSTNFFKGGDPASGKLTEEFYTELENQRFRTALELVRAESWDLLVHVFTLTDRIHHAFHRHRTEGADTSGALPGRDGFADAVDRAYQRVDGWIGELLPYLSAGTLVAVVLPIFLAGITTLTYTYRLSGSAGMAAVSSLLASITWPFLSQFTTAMSEAVFLPLLVWTAAELVRLERRVLLPLRALVPATALLSLLTLTRYAGVFALGGALLCWSLRRFRQGRTALLWRELPVLGSAIVPLLVWLARNQLLTGYLVGSFHLGTSRHTVADGMAGLVKHLTWIVLPAIRPGPVWRSFGWPGAGLLGVLMLAGFYLLWRWGRNPGDGDCAPSQRFSSALIGSFSAPLPSSSPHPTR